MCQFHFPAIDHRIVVNPSQFFFYLSSVLTGFCGPDEDYVVCVSGQACERYRVVICPLCFHLGDSLSGF